ncbi:MAG: LysR family transcriptional regulator [Pseudomonadota bacterium]
MNLAQLSVFREIMETGSVSQAARNLGRTQPAVSLALKSLEDDLGLPLFERRGRRLHPVPEARYLLSEATGVLERVATMSRTMKTMQRAESGLLNVASMPGPATVLFPQFLSEVMGASPDLRVSMFTRTSLQARELVRSQVLDFAFIDHEPGAAGSEQIDETVISGACFLALSADHPLAAQTEVDIAELSGEPFGVLHAETPQHKAIARAFEIAGSTLNVRIRSQIHAPLIQFAAEGRCCAIVDPLAVASERRLNATAGKIVFRELAAPIRYEYALLSPRFRALSLLAAEVRDAWRGAVVALLADMGAAPEVREIAAPQDAETPSASLTMPS